MPVKDAWLLLYCDGGESSRQARRTYICVLCNPISCLTPLSLLNVVTHKFCYNGIIYLILLYPPHSFIICLVHLDLSLFVPSFLFLEITSE